MRVSLPSWSMVLGASWPFPLIAGAYLAEWWHPVFGRLVNTLIIGLLLCASVVYLRRAKRYVREAVALRTHAEQLVRLAERVQDSVAPRGPRH